TDAALYVAGVGVVQMRTAQFAVGVVNLQTVFIEYAGRQRIFAAGLEPALVRIMHERRVGDVFAPKLIVVEMIAPQSFDKLTQRRRQRAFLGGALAIGKAHWGVSVADMQRPYIGNNIAPRSDFDLHAQIRQNA